MAGMSQPHTAPSSSLRLRRWLLPLALLLAVAAAVAWRMRPPEADVLQLQTQPLTRTLQFTARVQTPQRVDIGATVTARVAAVPVKEGEAVAAGATLVQLEDDEARAALAQAEAALKQALARRDSQQAVQRPAADAALDQANATLATAERDLARSKELVAQGFVSAARIDEAQRAVDIARAQRDSARAAAAAQRGQGVEVVAAAAQLQAAQAALQVARARLDQSVLRAPAAGRVLLRAVEPGQIVQPGRALLTLGVDGPVELVALVDERFLGQLQPGQEASVLADAFPQQPFRADVQRLAPAVDAQRGAIDVRLRLPGAPPAFLREDMTLSVEVVTGARAAARVLPLRVLRGAADGDRAVVGVVEGGHVRARPVKLGLRTLDRAEVLEGLADGDTVLVDPGLAEGARVRVRLLPPGQESGGARGGVSRDMAGGASPMANFGR
jgi:HlyD family secretion protein